MIDWTSLKQQPESGLSASRRISRLLVAAIQSGLLKPGMRLKEAELVTALDVGRTLAGSAGRAQCRGYCQ